MHGEIIPFGSLIFNKNTCIYAGFIDFGKVDCAASPPTNCLSSLVGALRRGNGREKNHKDTKGTKKKEKILCLFVVD
jgi:hypothetical protein